MVLAKESSGDKLRSSTETLSLISKVCITSRLLVIISHHGVCFQNGLWTLWCFFLNSFVLFLFFFAFVFPGLGGYRISLVIFGSFWASVIVVCCCALEFWLHFHSCFVIRMCGLCLNL